MSGSQHPLSGDQLPPTSDPSLAHHSLGSRARSSCEAKERRDTLANPHHLQDARWAVLGSASPDRGKQTSVRWPREASGLLYVGLTNRDI